MQTANYVLFCEQLQSTIRRYPKLRIKEVDGLQILKGIVDIPNDNNEIVGSFSIEIAFRKEFPYRFPILYEVGGDIPKLADWHKYSNNSCCLTVEPNEILICKNGINVLFFIENVAIPYFANQVHRKIAGYYKNGEFGHGALGLKQFYSGLLKTADENKWREYFEIAFVNKPLRISRNDCCFCGSNIKYKNCHHLIFQNLRLIGGEQVYKDFKIIFL